MTPKDDPLSEQRLDALLSSLPAPEPSAALRRAVAEIPLRHPRVPGMFGPVPEWFPFASVTRALLLAAAVLALGALAGLSGEDDLRASGAPDALPSRDAALADADAIDAGGGDEAGELAALAFADALDTELSP